MGVCLCHQKGRLAQRNTTAVLVLDYSLVDLEVDSGLANNYGQMSRKITQCKSTVSIRILIYLSEWT